MERRGRLRARRGVALSGLKSFAIPAAFAVRIVRTNGLGQVQVIPVSDGGSDGEPIALPVADDGWLILEGRAARVELVGGTTGLPCTCDIEFMDGPVSVLPLPPARSVLLVDEAFDVTQLGLVGVLQSLNPTNYPRGADLLGFRLDSVLVYIPAGWTGVGTQVQASCLISSDGGYPMEDASYASAQVAQLYTAGATPANAIRFFGRFGAGSYRSDFTTNFWSLSSSEAPGVEARYFDVFIRAIAGTLTAIPGARIQLRGRPLR